MKSVTYKEIIIIQTDDGIEEHVTVFEMDYTESIQQALNDKLIEPSKKDICDYIIDDIVNMD